MRESSILASSNILVAGWSRLFHTEARFPDNPGLNEIQITIKLTCRHGAQRHGGQVERLVRLSSALFYAFWAVAELNNAKPYSQIPSLGNMLEYLVPEQRRPFLASRP